MFKKIAAWYKSQNPTTKGMILVGILLVIGIIIRWDYVLEHIIRGFNFYNNK